MSFIKKIISNPLLKIAIAIGILFLLAQSGKLNTKEILATLNPVWIITMLGLLGLGFLFCSLRFKYTIKIFNLEISSFHSWKLFLIGLFFNFALPGGVGGDAVKAYYIYRDNESSYGGALGALLDRILGLVSLLTLSSFMYMLTASQISDNALNQLGTIIAVCTLLGWAFVFSLFGLRKIILDKIESKNSHQMPKWVLNILQFAQRLLNNPKNLLISFFLSLVTQLFFTSVIYVAMLSLGKQELTVVDILFISSFGFLVSSIPLTPAAIGVGQAAFLFFTNSYTGTETTLGATLITVYQLMSLIWGFVGCYYYLRMPKSVKN